MSILGIGLFVRNLQLSALAQGSGSSIPGVGSPARPQTFEALVPRLLSSAVRGGLGFRVVGGLGFRV